MENSRETHEDVDREFGTQPPEEQEEAPGLEALSRTGQGEVITESCRRIGGGALPRFPGVETGLV